MHTACSWPASLESPLRRGTALLIPSARSPWVRIMIWVGIGCLRYAGDSEKWESKRKGCPIAIYMIEKVPTEKEEDEGRALGACGLDNSR